MTDIKIDQDTNDIIYQDNDYVFIDNTVDLLIQRLKIQYQTFKGEDVFDIDRGVPYFQIIFRKGTNKTNADSIFRRLTLATDGVQSITEFRSTYSNSARTYRIEKMTVLDTQNRVISINLNEVSA